MDNRDLTWSAALISGLAVAALLCVVFGSHPGPATIAAGGLIAANMLI